MNIIIVEEVKRIVKSGGDVKNLLQKIYDMGKEEGYIKGVNDMTEIAKKLIDDTFSERRNNREDAVQDIS